MIKRSLGEKAFGVFNTILLAGFSLLALYPMLYVLFASFSNPGQFAKHYGLLAYPTGFSTLAYEKVFQKPEIFIGYGNTLIYVVAGTLISLFITMTFAYVLSRKNLYWGRALSIVALITMYFSGGLIPTYLVVKNLGLIDTRWAILLPGAMGTYNMIIMRSGFASVPISLEESARIDGATPIKILFRIIIPLSMPTVAVIALYYAVAQWNSWFQAAIYLRSLELYPLQLFLRDILINNTQDDMLIETNTADMLALSETIKYATIIVSVVPILCLYPFLQKYFTKGVMVGAVKG